MRKLLKVKVLNKKTKEENEYHKVYDFGHFWDGERQYFSVLVYDNDLGIERFALEPKTCFVITIEEEEEEIDDDTD